MKLWFGKLLVFIDSRIKQFDKEQEESEPIDEERVKQIYEEEQTKNEQLFKEIENNMQKLDISNVTYG